MAVLALQIRLEGAELGLGALDRRRALRLLDIGGELPTKLSEFLLSRADISRDLHDEVAHVVDIPTDLRHIVLDLIQMALERCEVD